MLNRKRLGKEYKNTCVMQFLNHVNIPRMLKVLERLNMIDTDDYAKFYQMKELSASDHIFNEFIKNMNEIAPNGCEFQIRNSYFKVKESEHISKLIDIGFYC